MPDLEDDIPLEEVGYYDYAAELGMPYFHWGGIRATDRLVELLKISTESQVLMVGCGTGYTACYIADKTGCSMVGIDISPMMIERANERLEEWNLHSQVSFQGGDAHHLQFEAESFDIVMDEFVTVFLEKEQALAQYYRVLKDGGCVGMNELFMENDIPMAAKEKIKEAQKGFEDAAGLPLRIPTLSQWRSVFDDAGFSDVYQEEVDYKYSYREMIDVIGFVKLLRMTGRTLWDMATNKKFRKRMWPIGRLKDTLVRDELTSNYAGAVLCIAHKAE